MSDKRDAFMYMRGWYCSAGCKPIPEEYKDNRHFQSGYNQGALDSARARIECQREYNIEFAIIKAKEREEVGHE